MIPATDAFLELLPKSHTVGFLAEIYAPLGERKAVLAIDDGSVTADRNNSIRRSCQVQLSDKLGLLTPKVADDLLWPNGNEIKLSRGIVVDGVPELKSLGFFRLSRPSVSFDQVTKIKLQGYDRAKTVSRAKVLRSTSVASKYVQNAIHDLLEDRYPGLTYDFEASSYKIEATGLEPYDDPWAKAWDWAVYGGLEVYFDTDGVVVLREIPDPTINQPVATYTDGEGATVLSVSKDIDEESAYNGYIVVSTSVPGIRAEAWDLDPLSPTYRYGPYGEYPAPIVQVDSTNQAQLQAMANGLMRNRQMFLETTTMEIIPDPTKEPGDVVLVNSDRWGFDNVIAVVQSIEMPCRHDGKMKLSLGTRSYLG